MNEQDAKQKVRDMLTGRRGTPPRGEEKRSGHERRWVNPSSAAGRRVGQERRERRKSDHGRDPDTQVNRRGADERLTRAADEIVAQAHAAGFVTGDGAPGSEEKRRPGSEQRRVHEDFQGIDKRGFYEGRRKLDPVRRLVQRALGDMVAGYTGRERRRPGQQRRYIDRDVGTYVSPDRRFSDHEGSPVNGADYRHDFQGPRREAEQQRRAEDRADEATAGRGAQALDLPRADDAADREYGDAVAEPSGFDEAGTKRMLDDAEARRIGDDGPLPPPDFDIQGQIESDHADAMAEREDREMQSLDRSDRRRDAIDAVRRVLDTYHADGLTTRKVCEQLLDEGFEWAPSDLLPGHASFRCDGGVRIDPPIPEPRRGAFELRKPVGPPNQIVSEDGTTRPAPPTVEDLKQIKDELERGYDPRFEYVGPARAIEPHEVAMNQIQDALEGLDDEYARRALEAVAALRGWVRS